MLDRAEPIAPIASQPAQASAPRSAAAAAVTADPVWLKAVVWLLVGAYILGMGKWSFDQGMRIRDETWVNTRTIRFHGDIKNGIQWGSLVIRTAERLANSQDYKKHLDPKIANLRAAANPTPGDPNQRALTLMELYRGVDQVYKEFVFNESEEGNFGLDYPPMRLFAMTLWTRHVRDSVPNLQVWPGPYEMRYSDTGDPNVLASEDIASSVLLGNTYSIAAAAVFGFFLVWIWVNRGGRPALPGVRTGWTAWFATERRLVPWKPTPVKQLGSLLVFAIAAWAFFYAVVIAENPTPANPPTIALQGRPILTKSAKGLYSAIITANVSGEGSDAQWWVDWGTTPRYTGHTSADSVGTDDVTQTLTDLPAATVIHYRVNARSDRGITRGDDLTFNTADLVPPAPPTVVYGNVWLDWRQWVGIGLLFIAMSVALRRMPPVHRGWAAGLSAALFIWFDPCVIVDTHIWPQWDAWVLPPFMLAALLATLDWWFMAGMVLGVGVMFKGQTMVAAPVLMIWPLFGGRWGKLARIVTGFVTAAGLVLSPWLALDNRPVDWGVGPARWILSVACAAAVAGALSLYRGPIFRRVRAVWVELKEEWHGPAAATGPTAPGAAAPPIDRPATSFVELVVFFVSCLATIVMVTVLVLGRWPADRLSEVSIPKNVFGLALLLSVLIIPWLLPRKALPIFLAGVVGASIWMSASLFHGDWTWKTVGFEYGTRKFTRMALGNGANGNLGQILESRFGWDVHDPAFTLRLPDIADPLHLAKRGPDGTMTGFAHDWGLDGTPATLDIRQFLMLVYVTMLVAIGLGASIHARRGDPRFLACLAAVWMLMPNTLCQMANRYETWGAAMSSLLIGVSGGMVVLHVIFSLLGAGMIGEQLLNSDPSRSPFLHELMRRFGPDDGWIMLTIALVFAYVAIAPGRRPDKQELLPP